MKTPKPKQERKFRILGELDRYKIDLMIRHGYRVVEIAEEIGCHRSTIYNELKRARYMHTNTDLTEEERYNPDQAQKLHVFNQSNKGPQLKIDKDHKQAELIETLIVEQKYSPEEALYYIHNLVESGEETFEVEIKSPNTIYSYIDKEIFSRLSRKHLPVANKERRKYEPVVRIERKPKTDRIDKRPPEIETRETFGNWEMDTVKGKREKGKSLLVLTERKTRYEIIEPLKEHTQDEVRKALNRIEKEYGSEFFRVFKTVTVDNGSEFLDWETIEKALYRVGKRWKLYFCHPYSSWERGSNENGNKLIRRHAPKGTSFDDKTRKDIKVIQNWMNDYPRGQFGGKSARMMYDAEIAKLRTG